MHGRARSILLAMIMLSCFNVSAGNPQGSAGTVAEASGREGVALCVNIPLPSIQSSHLPWRWNSTEGIYLPDTQHPETCVTLILRSPERKDLFDVWCFRAERSRISGFADDLHLLADGVFRADSGSPAWRVILPPVFFEGEEVLSRYAFRPPAGSRGDVKVSGFFDPRKKTLSLVFERIRDTGHPDDLTLGSGMEYAILLHAPGKIPSEEKLSFRSVRFTPVPTERSVSAAKEKAEKKNL